MFIYPIYSHNLRNISTIYSIWYYPQFHVTAVGLGTYYPWIRGSACSRFSQFPNSLNDSKRSELWMCTTMKCWWQHLSNLTSGLRWPKVKRASCTRPSAGESWREIHSDWEVLPSPTARRSERATFTVGMHITLMLRKLNRCFKRWHQPQLALSSSRSQPSPSWNWKSSGKDFALPCKTGAVGKSLFHVLHCCSTIEA